MQRVVIKLVIEAQQPEVDFEKLKEDLKREQVAIVEKLKEDFDEKRYDLDDEILDLTEEKTQLEAELKRVQFELDVVTRYLMGDVE